MQSKNRFEILLAWEETYLLMSVKTVYSLKPGIQYKTRSVLVPKVLVISFGGGQCFLIMF